MNHHNTVSRSRGGLPLIVKLDDQVHTFIVESLAEQRSEQSG